MKPRPQEQDFVHIPGQIHDIGGFNVALAAWAAETMIEAVERLERVIELAGNQGFYEGAMGEDL